MSVNNSLLLDLPLPFKKSNLSKQGYLVESQALNGLKRWSDNFDKVTVCAPIEQEYNQPDSTMIWADPSELLANRNIVLEPLPMGYHPHDFIKYKKTTYEKYHSLVNSHQYLCFANIGGMGAWGNLGVDIASKQNRQYSLWFDWVLDQVPAKKGKSMLGNIKNMLDDVYAKHKTYTAIEKSSLGLFHGKTVYDAYAPHCKNPQLVHNIHLSEHEAITDKQLHLKLQSLHGRRNIRIGYLGRAHPMKAPNDWIEVVSKVCKKLGKERVNATWIGDGALLAASRQEVETRHLTDVIHFSGFVSDRKTILNFLQEIDVFLFCHVTPESPRCLIEALISGTPIIGYQSAYATELVGDRGGALFSKMRDMDTLVEHICTLANDRNSLYTLTKQAALSKSIYNDIAVFKHRSDLIKAYL